MSEAFKEQPNPFEKRREERSVVVEEWKQREALRESRISTETPRTKSWGTSELEFERWKIEFSIGKAMRYHAYRRAFWERIAQRTKIVMLIGAAVILAALVGNKSLGLSEVAAVVVAALAAIDIVV